MSCRPAIVEILPILCLITPYARWSAATHLGEHPPLAHSNSARAKRNCGGRLLSTSGRQRSSRKGAHTQSGQLTRRHVFATAVEYIGREAGRWEEDSHFGADEDSAIAYGLSPADRESMIEALRNAVRVEKVGVRRLAKQARVADRAVTAVVSGDTSISGESGQAAQGGGGTVRGKARRRSADYRAARMGESAGSRPSLGGTRLRSLKHYQDTLRENQTKEGDRENETVTNVVGRERNRGSFDPKPTNLNYLPSCGVRRSRPGDPR
jgi:hypothetical protein